MEKIHIDTYILIINRAVNKNQNDSTWKWHIFRVGKYRFVIVRVGKKFPINQINFYIEWLTFIYWLIRQVVKYI